MSAEDDARAEADLKKAQGDLAQAASTTTDEPSAVAVAEPTPAEAKVEEVQAAPTPNAEELAQQVEKLTADIADLQKRKRDLAGELGGELDKRSREQVKELTEALRAAQAEIDELKLKAAPLAQIDDNVLMEGIDPDVVSVMDPAQLALMKQMVKNATVRVGQKDRTEILAEVEKRDKALRAQQANSAYDAFTDSVEALEPGFAKVNGSFRDNMQVDGDWIGFLDQERPGTVESWRHYIDTNRRPKEASAEAFREFKKFKGITTPPKKVASDPSGQVQPARRSAAPVVRDEGAPVSVAEQRTRLADKLAAGKISVAEWEKQDAVLAEKDGMTATG